MARNLGPVGLLTFTCDDWMRTLPLQPGMPEIRGVHQMCEVNDSTLYLACDTDALVELTIGKGDRPVVTAMRRYRFRLERRDCNEFYALIRESDSIAAAGHARRLRADTLRHADEEVRIC